MGFAYFLMLAAPIVMPITLLIDSRKRLGKFRWGWAIFACFTPVALISEFNRIQRLILTSVNDTGVRGVDMGMLYGIVAVAYLVPFWMYRSSTKKDVTVNEDPKEKKYRISNTYRFVSNFFWVLGAFFGLLIIIAISQEMGKNLWFYDPLVYVFFLCVCLLVFSAAVYFRRKSKRAIAEAESLDNEISTQNK